MKMKVVDAIRKTSDEQIAKIIGGVILQHTDGIPAEEAIKFNYPNVLKELQREIEIDYKPTNADRIRSMSDEELAKLIAEKIGCTECPFNGAEEKCGDVGCSELFLDWLQSEVKEEA